MRLVASIVLLGLAVLFTVGFAATIPGSSDGKKTDGAKRTCGYDVSCSGAAIFRNEFRAIVFWIDLRSKRNFISHLNGSFNFASKVLVLVGYNAIL